MQRYSKFLSSDSRIFESQPVRSDELQKASTQIDAPSKVNEQDYSTLIQSAHSSKVAHQVHHLALSSQRVEGIVYSIQKF